MAEIRSLNIIQHNVLAWKAHQTQLRQVYLSLNPHLILINSHGCKNNEKIKVFNYFIIQKNKFDEAHDGVAIGVRRDIKFQLVRLQDMLAVRVELAHEEIVIATGYCPFRRSFLPISDLIKLFNMNVPSYVIGDFNIKSIKLGDGYNNKFGSQFNILYKTGKVIHEGPHFPTFFGGRAGTTPDLILTNNKALF